MGINKNKVIGGVVVAVVGVAIASKFYSPSPSKETIKQLATDSAKSAGKLALDKGREKLKDMKERHEAKVSENIANNLANQVATDTNNVLKNVESTEFISIDNVAIKADFADTMLMNAINSGDLNRVKYLVESGVNVTFTDDQVCMAQVPTFDHKGSFDSESKRFPKEVTEMKSFIGVSSAKRQVALTTKCSKMFLLNAANKLNRRFNEEEFFYYNRAWLPDTPKERIQPEQQKIDEEKTREEIYKFILSKTQKKDLYQLPFVFLNSDIPLAIRTDALDKYLSIDPNEPITQSRAAFLKMYEEAAGQLMADSPNSKQLMAAVSLFRNPWALYFTSETKNFIDYANVLELSVESIRNNIEQERKSNVAVDTLEVPYLTVQSFEDGEIKFNESSTSGFWYYSSVRSTKVIQKYAFEALHNVNAELKIINTLVGSKKVNLNYQDLQGNTILHFLSAGNGFNFSAQPRPLATLTRYFLNNGVNSNLVNKEGKTAFMIAQENSMRSGASNSGWGDLNKAYTDKSYN